MHLITAITAAAGLLGLCMAAPSANAAAAAAKYNWSGTKWNYGAGQHGDPYSVTIKGPKHGDIPKFKAACTGTIGAEEAECTVAYTQSESGGDLRLWARMKIKTDADDSTERYPKVIVKQFYDNGIVCGETWIGSYVGPLVGGDTTEDLFPIFPEEDFSC